MPKINFTPARIANFRCEQGKSQSFLWDTSEKGLGLRVTAKGTNRTIEAENSIPPRKLPYEGKSFIFQAKLKGEVIRITIGTPSNTKNGWTIENARAKASSLRTLINEGKDPRKVKADELEAEQLARIAKETERAAKSRQESIENDRRNLVARDVWNAYLEVPHPKWGKQYRIDHNTVANAGGEPCKIGNNTTKPAPLAFLLSKPLHEITAQVVSDWLVDECAKRPTFAHNSFRKFRTFIKWCATHPEYKHIVHSDCCTTKEVREVIPTSKTKDGDCLQREQLPDWFSAVLRIGNPVICAYLQSLLLTGARRGELAIVKWEDIDFKWNSMTIRDKVEGFRTIPLTPYVSHLLSSLPRRSEWVFSSTTAASGYITEPRIAHTQALKVAGLPHVSLHGLRRSFGTLAEWVEIPTGIVAQIQGHKPSALAEKHYRRRPIDLLRMWHVKLETWILEQAQINFVPIQAGLRVVTTA